LVIPIRCVSFVLTVDIIRAGRQAARIPYLVTAMGVLAVGGVIGLTTHSLEALVVFRVLSEVTLMLGYSAIVRRLAFPRVVPIGVPIT
jgi:hypothetical protein